MEKPLDGGSDLDVLRCCGARGEGFEEDQDETGTGMDGLGFEQGTGSRSTVPTN